MGNFITLALLLTSLLLASCAKEQGATSLEVTVAALNTTATGEVFLIAHNPSTNQIRREHLVTDPQLVQIPNGVWNFYLVLYDGGITGTPRCASKPSTSLSGTPVSLSFNVFTANCSNLPFSQNDFVDTGVIQQLVVHSCGTSIPSLGTNCAVAGETNSFKVSFPNIDYSLKTNPVFSNSGYNSQCFTSLTAGSRVTGIKLISGSSMLDFPFQILSYTSDDCSTTPQKTTFAQGLRTPQTTSGAIYDNTTYSPDQSWVYIKHASTAMTPLFNNFTIPAESSYPMDVNQFFTGGVAPFTYNCISCPGGTLSSNGIFTNDGTVSAKTVEVVDANSNSITLTMSPVAGVIHDFTAGTDNGWAVTRSTANFSVPSAVAEFTVPSANIPRYWNPTATSQKGLLLEEPRTNLQTNYAILSSTYTTPVGGANSQSAIVVSPYSLSTSTRIQDGSAVSSSLLNSLTFPSLNGMHTFSVYLKAGTSNIAAINLAEVTVSCNSIVVDLSSGTFTNSSSCSAGQVGGVTPIGGGWYRVWLRLNYTGAGVGMFSIYPAWNSTLNATESVAASGYIEAWGAQFEAGRYPTTPIETTNMTVSRTAEYAIATNSIVPTLTSQATMLLKWNSMEDEETASVLLHAYNTSAAATSGMKLAKTAANKLSFTLANAASPVTVESLNALNTTTGENKAIMSFGPNRITLATNSSTDVVSQSIAATPSVSFNRAILGTATGTAPYSTMTAYKVVTWDASFQPEILKQMLAP